MRTWNTYWSRRVSVLITAAALTAPVAVIPTAHGATITYTDNNCTSFSVSGAAPNFTLICNAGTTTPPPATTVPSGCTLAANPNNLPAGGGTVTLTASCSGGGASSAYLWSGGSITTNTTTPVQVTNVTANTIFYVIPSNAAGAGNAAAAVVNVGAATGGGGGGGGAGGFCSQYSNVVTMDVPWGGQQTTLGNGSPFVNSGILVARFTVPAGVVYGSGSQGKIQVAEFGDPPTYRQASLSTQPCDFRGVAVGQYDQYAYDIAAVQALPLFWGLGNTATVFFTVTGNALFRPQLQPGQTYYYNVRNWSPYGNGGTGSVSCTTATCNVVVSINTP
jgi:hypothetical protein